MAEDKDSAEILLEQVGPLVHLDTLENLFNIGRSNSLWPLTFGLACCAMEMMAVGASRFDLDRIGAGVFRPSARQADVMILAGTISRKMGPVLKTQWDQLPSPRNLPEGIVPSSSSITPREPKICSPYREGLEMVLRVAMD